MPKRTKRPLVEPVKRRDWFRRYEEEGQSVPQIAKAVGYDARTVRKQIDLERQERERKEARSTVLRKALEQHYADLCTHAQNLASSLGKTNKLATLKGDRMWSALREHLPRLLMWKSLDKLEQLRAETPRLERDIEKLVAEQVESRSKAKFGKSASEVGLNWRVKAAIREQIEFAADGQPQYLHDFNFEKIADSAEKGMDELVKGILDEAGTWNEFEALSNNRAELRKLNKIVLDELAVITLRRVVPGKCKYCPV